MRTMCNSAVLLSVLVFSAALLLAQSVIAVEPGAVSPEDGKAMVEQKKEALVILDVRNPNEYIAAHYPGALNIPVNELEDRIFEVPAGKPVLVYCAKGRRALRGYAILKEKRPDIPELYYINGDTLF